MKLTAELIEQYLEGSLGEAQASALEAWLKSHPADAAKLERQRRLSDALRASAPELSAARSREMWKNIKTRVQAEQAGVPVLEFKLEPWYAFIFRPAPASFATAALVLGVLVWQPWKPGASQMEVAVPHVQAEADASASGGESARAREATERAVSRAEDDRISPSPSKRMSSDESLMAKAPVKAMAPVAEEAELAVARPASELTEVERALADSGVDGMIDSYLAAQSREPMSGSHLAGLGNRSAASPLAGFSGSAAPAAASVADLDSESLVTVLGGQDQNGFWNWTPAATALNRREWGQAKLELQAARLKAAEPSERAFAASALTLLSAPGAPLAGQAGLLPDTGALRVLGAGRWQLLVDSRVARFSEGVSARLPGFRAEGDSLLLDLTFDRGTFSPGTRFTRLAGEAPAEIVDAQGRALVADEFSAPAGAVYNVSGRQLKLR